MCGAGASPATDLTASLQPSRTGRKPGRGTTSQLALSEVEACRESTGFDSRADEAQPTRAFSVLVGRGTSRGRRRRQETVLNLQLDSQSIIVTTNSFWPKDTLVGTFDDLNLAGGEPAVAIQLLPEGAADSRY